jgi:hypothetical protein
MVELGVFNYQTGVSAGTLCTAILYKFSEMYQDLQVKVNGAFRGS